MATTSALMARIRTMSLQTGPRSTFTDAEIIATCLNPTVREIVATALVVSKSVTIATVIGQTLYAIPASVFPFIRASSVRIGIEKRPLKYATSSAFLPVTITGSPQQWTYWDNQFRISPPPTSVETIYLDAHGGPAPCAEITPSSFADELLFPPDAEDAAVYGSSSMLCAISNEPTRAVQYAELYSTKIGLIRLRLVPSADTRSNRDEVRDGFRGDNNFI